MILSSSTDLRLSRISLSKQESLSLFIFDFEMRRASGRNGRPDSGSIFGGKNDQKDITSQNKDRLARIAEELGQMRVFSIKTTHI